MHWQFVFSEYSSASCVSKLRAEEACTVEELRALVSLPEVPTEACCPLACTVLQTQDGLSSDLNLQPHYPLWTHRPRRWHEQFRFRYRYLSAGAVSRGNPNTSSGLGQFGLIKDLTPSGSNHKYLFLRVLESGSPKSGCWSDWTPLRILHSWKAHLALSLYGGGGQNSAVVRVTPSMSLREGPDFL